MACNKKLRPFDESGAVDKVRRSFTVLVRAALVAALGLTPETRHLKPCRRLMLS